MKRPARGRPSSGWTARCRPLFACPVKPMRHMRGLRRADPRTYPNTRPPNKNAHRCAATTFGEGADRRGNALPDSGLRSPSGREQTTWCRQTSVAAVGPAMAGALPRAGANGGGDGNADFAMGAGIGRICMMEPPRKQLLTHTLRRIDDCEYSQNHPACALHRSMASAAGGGSLKFVGACEQCRWIPFERCGEPVLQRC